MQKNMFLSLLAKEGIQFVDLPASTIEELRDKATQNADKVNVFITTQDTLIQGGGEEAIIKVALEKKIPILSSNKTGIEKGSAFGPVADFHTLGKMSGKMAAKILKEKSDPADMKSQKQEPPVILINKKTIKTLGIEIPEEKLQNVGYVE
jgi:putative ABC transport system substrate-binding protein